MGSDRPFLIYCHQALGRGGSAAAGRPGRVENATPRAQRIRPRAHRLPEFSPRANPGGGQGKARVQSPQGDARRGLDNGRREPARGTVSGGRPTPLLPGGSGGGSELGSRPRRGAAPGSDPVLCAGRQQGTGARGPESSRPCRASAQPLRRLRPPARVRRSPPGAPPVPTRRAPCRPGSAHSPAHGLVGQLLRG